MTRCRASSRPDATGVVLNVTATNGSGRGFVTVFPAGATQPGHVQRQLPDRTSPRPTRYLPGIGNNRQVTLFVGGRTAPRAHLIVDVVGYLTAGAAPAPSGSASPVAVSRSRAPRRPARPGCSTSCPRAARRRAPPGARPPAPARAPAAAPCHLGAEHHGPTTAGAAPPGGPRLAAAVLVRQPARATSPLCQPSARPSTSAAAPRPLGRGRGASGNTVRAPALASRGHDPRAPRSRPRRPARRRASPRHYGDPYAEQRRLEDARDRGCPGRPVAPRRSSGQRAGPAELAAQPTAQHLTGLCSPAVPTQALVLSPQGHVEHHLQLVDDGEAVLAHVEPGTADALVEFLQPDAVHAARRGRRRHRDRTPSSPTRSRGWCRAPSSAAYDGPLAGVHGVRGAARRRPTAAPRAGHRPPDDPARGRLARRRGPPGQGLLPRAGDRRARPQPGPAPSTAGAAAPRRLRQRAARHGRRRPARRPGRRPGRHGRPAPRARPDRARAGQAAGARRRRADRRRGRCGDRPGAGLRGAGLRPRGRPLPPARACCASAADGAAEAVPLRRPTASVASTSSWYATPRRTLRSALPTAAAGPGGDHLAAVGAPEPPGHLRHAAAGAGSLPPQASASTPGPGAAAERRAGARRRAVEHERRARRTAGAALDAPPARLRSSGPGRPERQRGRRRARPPRRRQPLRSRPVRSGPCGSPGRTARRPPRRRWWQRVP